MKRKKIIGSGIDGVVAQTPFCSLKGIFEHSKAHFTANLKLALWTQTIDFRPFRFAKNGELKFFNIRSRGLGSNPLKYDLFDKITEVEHLSIGCRVSLA